MKSNFWDRTRERIQYARLAIYGAVIIGYLGWMQSSLPPQALAQVATPGEKLEEITEPAAPASTGSATDSSSKVPTTMWDMYVASGLIGYIITLLSVIALGFIVEHFI